MQTRRAILNLVVLITLTTDFGNSAQLSSAKDNDVAVPGFSGSNLSNRLKRRSASVEREDGDIYPPESVYDNGADGGDWGRNSEGINFDKRASSFVRIGRYPTMNRFVRIGRMAGNEPNYNDEYEHDISEPQSVSAEDYPSSLDLSGRLDSVDDELDKRASGFVRIGKSLTPFSDQPGSFMDTMKRTSHFARFDRAPSSFVRIGKAPSSFVRIGKAPSSFVRIGKAPSSFVRIGKAPSSFVRIGKASNFVRIGRGPSSFVRIGKPYFDADDKRAGGFVRIGKSSNLHTAEFPENYNELYSDFVNRGEHNDNRVDLLKRASNFVRIGKSSEEDKRASGFVRIGKSEHSEDDDKKRASGFVRIGKAGLSQDLAADLEKKASSFVRIGKSLHYGTLMSPSTANEHPADGSAVGEEQPIRLVNRASAFVRIGKIPSSAFVRIGKNKDIIIDPSEYRRGSQGSQSSFVRIG